MFDMNKFNLEGKIALVTGASYGIGFAIATALSKAGATICFNEINEEKKQNGLSAYEKEGIKAYGYVGDVTKEDEVNKLVKKIN